jgi:hypothetical protein
VSRASTSQVRLTSNPKLGPLSHLPAGRAAGPQSSRRASKVRRVQRLILWLVAGMAGAVGALTLALELLQAVGHATRIEPSDGAVVAAFVGGAALGLLSWAFWEDWWYRNRSPEVALTLDPSGLVRGGRVVGHLDLDAAGNSAGGATEVGLVCSELADMRVTLRGRLKEDGLGRTPT